MFAEKTGVKDLWSLLQLFATLLHILLNCNLAIISIFPNDQTFENTTRDSFYSVLRPSSCLGLLLAKLLRLFRMSCHRLLVYLQLVYMFRFHQNILLSNKNTIHKHYCCHQNITNTILHHHYITETHNFWGNHFASIRHF